MKSQDDLELDSPLLGNAPAPANWYAKITFSSDGKRKIPGYIMLTRTSSGWEWVPVGGNAATYLASKEADLLSHPAEYQYSPAHGAPGRLLAHQVAERMKGNVEYPGAVNRPEGVDY